MATVGQVTQTGGRDGLCHGVQGICRQVVVPSNATLDFIGVWAKETTTNNANNIRGAIYTTAGVLVAQTALLSNDLTTTYARKILNFAGQAISAGTYILAVSASENSGNVNISGQNGDSGSPTSMWVYPDSIHPDFLATVDPAVFDTAAARAWDLSLDYTPASAAATLSSPTPSGTIGTQTTATIGATTNQATGNFYVVVDTSANLSGVTATQIKAGQRASGAAALAAGDVAVSTTSPSVGVTGLLAGTSYAYAAIQNNANGDSNIVTGTFTTAAAVAASGATPGRLSGYRLAALMMS